MRAEMTGCVTEAPPFATDARRGEIEARHTVTDEDWILCWAVADIRYRPPMIHRHGEGC